MGVSAFSIVEHLDVIEHIGAGELAGFVDPFFDPLLFQAAEEGFGHGIIPAVAATAHTGFQVVLRTETHPVIATVLRALVGMHQHFFLGPTSPHGRHQGVEYDVPGQGRLHGPAHHLA